MDIDPRLTEAMTHVQRAGLELIAAMRNALDIAEDLLGDPQALTVLFQGTVEAAKSATEMATETVQRVRVDD